jgi:hypothetical protein
VRLQGVDVTDRLATLDEGLIEVRYADPSHQAVLDQSRHRLPGLLEWDIPIGSMQLEEVDTVAAQSLEARFRGFSDVVRLEPRPSGARGDLREHEYVVVSLDRFAHQALGVSSSINLGRVEP